MFLSFSAIALQGFGGVIAIIQRELVEKKRWMTREQFVEDWAVAQILPGPNVVNLSLMIGGRHFGLSGALAALAGMLVAPLLVVLLMAIAFGTVADTPTATGALRGMGAVAAGLIIATGWLLSAAHSSAAEHWRLWLLTALATLMVWKTRVHLLALIVTGGLLGAFGLV
nr:chromate transporter [Tepidicella baoligensis]